ncbi:MAG: type V CRISPR-associated protein Cas12a/Cpf1 [Anaerovoracaceae bacterium]|jgi:CRISPR-associated protein Cpf1
MSDFYSNFIGMYPVSRTLRFELKPVAETLSNIEKSDMLCEDEHRDESAKKVKKIIDEYHKKFIERTLSDLKLSDLDTYYSVYNKSPKDVDDRKLMSKLEQSMREQIAGKMTKDDEYNNLFDNKNFIQKTLIAETADDEQKNRLVKEFKNFTTYFTGFFDNRENLYSPEDKNTAVGHRIVNDNLPKFLDNMKQFERIINCGLNSEIDEISSEADPFLNGDTLKSFFELDHFNSVMTQSGIDRYNAVVGVVNSHINKYNQGINKDDKSRKIGKMKPLYKQILSDRDRLFELPEMFETDQEVIDSVNNFADSLNKNEDIIEKVKNLLSGLDKFDLRRIYLTNDNQMNSMSKSIFDGDYRKIKDLIEEEYYNQHPGNHTQTYEKKKNSFLKSIKSYSIEDLQDIMPAGSGPVIVDYFCNGIKEICNDISASENEFRKLSDKPYPQQKNLMKDEKSSAVIKKYLDSILGLRRFIRPLLGSGTESDKDDLFYGEFDVVWEYIDLISPLYNKVRNYLTRKPYSTEKFKLNFSCSNFLDSWARNYENKNGELFEKDGIFYLGILNKKLSRDEIELLENGGGGNNPVRLRIFSQKPDSKNIPRLFIRSKREKFSPAVNKYNLPVNDIIDLYDNKKFKTDYKKQDEGVFRDSLNKLIEYYEEGLAKHDDYKIFDYDWKPSNQYESIADFCDDAVAQSYKVEKVPISWEKLLDLVKQDKIYLFKIWNKDFSEFSKGTPNMHTIYWRMLFDDRNINAKPVKLKLNGNAEIFYRKKSIDSSKTTHHEAGKPIENKNSNNEKKKSSFDYEIIKDRRFTVDKFQFHVPITLNFGSTQRDDINETVNRAIKYNGVTHIIGVDRGERNLLYVVVIDDKGKIVEQRSLNEIIAEYNDRKYVTDYHTLLDKKEKERDEARKQWKTIENIKELKEGYMSQVIHVLTTLMVKYNAVLVLEDLNSGFKRGRQKVEKQVYQKFEAMMVNKLNYLADKHLEADEEGGVLAAYQLTQKFESFKKMGSQNGLIYYIPPWNTSKLDPTTGFVNLFYVKYENVEKAQKFWDKFDRISYNPDDDIFEFQFDYKNFTERAGNSRTKWTVCSYGKRIRVFRNKEKNNQWDNEEIELTSEIKSLLDKYNVNYHVNDIKGELSGINDKEFQSKMISLFRLILQIRNSKSGTDIDYIQSCVRNPSGEFFNSDTASTNLPQDADANGAYNIARKGLYIIEKIKNTPDDKLKKINSRISNEEWLIYAQEHVIN